MLQSSSPRTGNSAAPSRPPGKEKPSTTTASSTRATTCSSACRAGKTRWHWSNCWAGVPASLRHGSPSQPVHIRMSNIAYHQRHVGPARTLCGIRHRVCGGGRPPLTRRPTGRKDALLSMLLVSAQGTLRHRPGETGVPQDSPRPSPGRPLRDFAHEHGLSRLFCHHASPGWP